MFWHTLIFIFLAEMADKTQLMMMALTNKYKMRSVIIGMMIGVITISALSVLAGDVIGDIIPMFLIKLCAACMFLIFGMINLLPSKTENSSSIDLHIPILSIALTFLLAELGDKTQLATVAIAADHMDQHLPIFCAASLGLILANLIGICAGRLIFSHFHEDTIKVISSFIFFFFGSVNVFEVMTPHPVILWIYSLLLISIAYLCFEKSRKKQCSDKE